MLSRIIQSSLIVSLLCCSILNTAHAREFFVEDVKTRLKDDRYVLNGRVDYNLSDTALEALDNGVPITMRVHVKVRRKNAWPWEPRIVHQQFPFVIRFQALSEKFQVENVVADQVRDYVTREAAIEALGDIVELPIINASELKSSEPYEIKVFAELDKDSLPLPLRPLAYFKSSWKLSSKWTRWPLEP